MRANLRRGKEEMEQNYTKQYFESEYLNKREIGKDITRDELRKLSRELLVYIPTSKDVGMLPVTSCIACTKLTARMQSSRRYISTFG